MSVAFCVGSMWGAANRDRFWAFYADEGYRRMHVGGRFYVIMPAAEYERLTKTPTVEEIFAGAE